MTRIRRLKFNIVKRNTVPDCSAVGVAGKNKAGAPRFVRAAFFNRSGSVWHGRWLLIPAAVKDWRKRAFRIVISNFNLRARHRERTILLKS